MRRFVALCLLLALFPVLFVQVSTAQDVQQPRSERVGRLENDQRLVSTSLDSPGYPTGWVFLPSVQRYYRVVFELVDWDTADERCRELGNKSHLVVVNDATENQAIRAFLSSIDARLSRVCRGPKVFGSKYGGYWTSGQRDDRTACSTHFIWKPYPRTRFPLTFNGFYAGEPNCYRGAAPEACIHYGTEYFSNFQWNDLNCDWPACALCELDL